MNNGLSQEKKNIVLQATQKTNDLGEMISVAELSKIVMLMKTLQKSKQGFFSNLKDCSMMKWQELIKTWTENSVIVDSSDFLAAIQGLIDEYPDLKDLDKTALADCGQLQVILDDASSKLNNLQMATSYLAYANSAKKKNQLWVIAAG